MHRRMCKYDRLDRSLLLVSLAVDHLGKLTFSQESVHMMVAADSLAESF